MTPADITILGAALLATITLATLAGVGIAIWLDGLEGRDWDQEQHDDRYDHQETT